jgi:hypothetical protein
MEGERQQEEQERPRPKVVDKRVSARTPDDAGPGPFESHKTAPPIEAPPISDEGASAAVTPHVAGETGPAPADARTDSAPADVETGPPPPSDVWTPEQEEQARRVAEELARVPSKDLVVMFAMNFVEAAWVKLETGDLPGAQMAIDAVDGIIKEVGTRLGDAESPMRSVLAQLQMTYAQRATIPPQNT